MCVTYPDRHLRRMMKLNIMIRLHSMQRYLKNSKLCYSPSIPFIRPCTLHLLVASTHAYIRLCTDLCAQMPETGNSSGQGGRGAATRLGADDRNR